MLLGLSGIYYFLLINQLLLQHKQRILLQYSNHEKINLSWLRFLFYGMVVMWLLIVFWRNDQVIFSAATIFTIFIGYFGIKQVGLLPTQKLKEEVNTATMQENTDAKELIIEKKKYAKSGLSEDAALELHIKLCSLMKNEKPYTEPELKLIDLSDKLNTHPNYLSQVINEKEGVNFYEYINRLRIEEFKEMISRKENQQFTIIGLAFECGFNSKASFNRFFKKTTGLSPAEYIKKNQA